ncbi:hypothetical protein QZH41_010940 [Actinostola sp. cb2023]|nr:hypothetical protein QZH41_010940 [Actinostola sp. cb2023]
MVQEEAFTDDLELLKGNLDLGHTCNDRHKARERKQVLKKSRLRELDPFIDENGVLRVGGHLRRSSLEFVEKHPAILPRDHHVSELLVRHHHETIHHQGRQITHGAVRQAGYWIVSGHRLVTKIISECITCRKSRGAVLTQNMADLPGDRTEPSPPFTNVGLDVFGPWLIRTRKLRGGAANSKRWGLVLTCLSTFFICYYENESEMADLGKKRKSRGGYRAHANKLVAQVHQMMESGENVEEYELRSVKTSLEERMEKIKTLDDAILAIMEDDETASENDVIKEIEETGSCSDAIRKAIMRIEARLQTKEIPQATSSKGETRTVQARLPKLEVKKFSGEVCQCQEFWDCFESSIHSNKEAVKN